MVVHAQDMEGPRFVRGWRERERETDERLLLAGQRKNHRIAAARPVYLIGDEVDQVDRRRSMDRRASDLRAYASKWAREHPRTGKAWRAAHREEDNAAARARYAKDGSAQRARCRERNQTMRDVARDV